MSTNTTMPPPTCENCGRDKSATYICDACVNKLNAATRKLTAERDELQRRLDAVVALIESKVPSEKRPTETQYQYINRQRYNNAQIQMGARIRAIAEGREG